MRHVVAKTALVGAVITWVWFFVLIAEGRALNALSIAEADGKRMFAVMQEAKRAGDNAESTFWIALSLSGVAWLGRR